jgi:tetratricopeptide (TPR) repeat protein
VWVLVLVAAVTALPVPFVPQERDTCAAAALSMVMGYHGRAVAHDEVAFALVEKELRGIRGSRLADFARERGMVAIAFAGDVGLLREHVGRGRPLILALDAGRGRYHDVVAIGFDDRRRRVIVHDPARGPSRAVGLATLARKWKATGNWALLVQPAGEPTADSSGAGQTGRPRNDSAAGRPRNDGSYEALVAEAIAAGRDGEEALAAAALERAIAIDPHRPEALTERGGLRFLQGRYGEAAEDLRRSLSRREDAYARDLLAASLQLDGRELEALAAWNPLGKPTLGALEISGITRTRDEVARREIGIERGDLLTPRALRAARRRLEETGAFDRVTLRTAPAGDGRASLEVALAERHGLGRGVLDVALTTGVNLAWKRLRVRYANLGGTGVGLGGSWRWQENREELAVQVQWPRLLGLPLVARASGFGGEQAFTLGSAFDMRRHGLDLSARIVRGDGSVATLGLRARERTFSAFHPDAPPGRLVGLEAALERRVVETRRHRLGLTARGFAALPGLGSDLRYAQADAEVRYEGVLSKVEGRTVERSVLAVRLRAGGGTQGLPVDEMYAPGISPESDLPLRAHPLASDGAIGRNPVGRSVLLGNAEWRQRVLHRPSFDVGLVAFADAARVGRAAVGSASTTLVDAGVGLRLSLLAGPTLRVDHAWGLRDGNRTLFVGLGQAF